jgi:hypothetical protein
MRQESKHSTEQQVYLLDTLNNVLCALVLVLILIQLVTFQEGGAEHLDDARLAELRAKLAALVAANQVPAATAANPVDAEPMPAEPATDPAVAAADAAATAELADLKKKIADLQALMKAGSKEDAEAAVARAAAELAKLQEETKKAERDLRFAKIDADVVDGSGRIDGKRGVAVKEAPKDAEFTYYVCANGRLLPFSQKTLVPMLLNGVNSVLRTRNNISEDEFDPVCKYFSDNDVGDAYFRITAKHTFNGRHNILVKFEPRANVGDGIDDLKGGTSEFGKFLQAHGADGNTRVFFYVFSDSFKAYLTSRFLVDEAGMSYGWDPVAAQKGLFDFLIKYDDGGGGGGGGGGGREIER